MFDPRKLKITVQLRWLNFNAKSQGLLCKVILEAEDDSRP